MDEKCLSDGQKWLLMMVKHDGSKWKMIESRVKAWLRPVDYWVLSGDSLDSIVDDDVTWLNGT